MRAEQLTDALCEHGEGAAYSKRWKGVRWMDMLAGDVLELDGSAVRRRHVDRVAAVIRPRRQGGFAVATERGLALTDEDDLMADFQTRLDYWDDKNIRMNEGGCDPAGHFYLGSMAYDQRPGAGTLYRIDASLRPTVSIPNVSVSNGIAWSPDGVLAYYADTAKRRIDLFDWTEEDGLHARRPFVTVDGDPDGLCTDSEGGVWVAMYGGGEVRRYNDQGNLDAVVELPVSNATSVTFAGEDLKQLVITTSRYGIATPTQPAAGALFTVFPGVRGTSGLEFCG